MWGYRPSFRDNWENMVKNDIFESMIKLCSANYAPSGAQSRAKLSVKIVRKGRTPTSQNYANLLSW